MLFTDDGLRGLKDARLLTLAVVLSMASKSSHFSYSTDTKIDPVQPSLHSKLAVLCTPGSL